MRDKRLGKQIMSTAVSRREDFQGKTWVTRKGIYVDRMASAWFIRRFIDSGARFKFVPAKGYNPLSGELRFDMFEAFGFKRLKSGQYLWRDVPESAGQERVIISLSDQLTPDIIA